MTLEEVLEVIKPTGEWAKKWYEDGVDEGKVLVLRQHATRKFVSRKFGPETAAELSRVLDQLDDLERTDEVANAVIDCDTGYEFLARVR